MTTTILHDTFTGSGSIAGHAPDTSFGALTWVNDAAPNDIGLSGGSAFAASASADTDTGSATIGDLAGHDDKGNPAEFEMTLDLHIGTVATPTLGETLVLWQVDWRTGGTAMQFVVSSVNAGDYSVTFCGVTTALDIARPLSPDVDTPATIGVRDGVQYVIFWGQTFTASLAFADPTEGLVGLSITAGTSHKLNEVTVVGNSANAVFYDTFTGSGSLTGHAPDTNAFGTSSWVNDTPPYDMALSGGYVVAPNVSAGTTDVGDATIGDPYGSTDGLTDYGNPSSIYLKIKFRTGGAIDAAGDGNIHTIVQANWQVGSVPMAFIVGTVDGTTDYGMQLLGSDPVIFSSPLTINTDYTAIIRSSDGRQTATIGSDVASANIAHVSAAGLAGLAIGAGAGHKIDELEADEWALNVVDVTLPMLAVDFAASGGADGVVDVHLPMLVVDFLAHETPISGVDAMLPMLVVEFLTGAQVDVSLPMLTVDAAATVTVVASVDVQLPMLVVDAAATVATVASVDVRLPMLTVEAFGGATVDATLPMLVVDASATVANVASVDVQLPMLTVDSAGTVWATATVDVTLPALQVAPYADVDVMLPMLVVEFTAHEVVTATYEAYALNLRHTGDPKGWTHELTRYTNFAFGGFIRYRGRYYGFNADGLFALEGDTDYDTGNPDAPACITHSVKTGFDDDGTTKKKTVVAAYMRGRIGHSQALTLYAGESADKANVYEYETPRGTEPQNHRQKFGLGIRADVFALGIEGNSELELDSLELQVAHLSRRI